MSLARRALSDAERLDWLRLIRSENVGPIGIMQHPPQAADCV
jgi:DprA-like N-terminal HHH domain